VTCVPTQAEPVATSETRGSHFPQSWRPEDLTSCCGPDLAVCGQHHVGTGWSVWCLAWV
jgi:hypothetical protein